MNKIQAIILNIIIIVKACNAEAALPNNVASFADIVEPLLPTVVNIYTVKYTNNNTSNKSVLPEIVPVDKLNKFLEQLNIPFLFDESYADHSTFSLGSGFIIDEDGCIITNYHVIDGSDEIFIKLFDNTELPAIIIGTDPKTDLALLKIDSAHKLPFATFADSSQLRIGDIVIAIGNPLGFGGSVTTGIISSKGRDLGLNNDELVDNFIQTDAAINTGNSGGPLFNIEGKIIGLNTALPDISGGTNIGIGFAIPSNTVHDIMHQLKAKGKIHRGKLDISVQQVTEELAEALSLSQNAGVLVVGTTPDGAGDKAGLKIGDLITEFNGKIVLNSRKLQLFVADCHIGDEVQLSIIRDHEPIKLTAQIVESQNLEEQQLILDKVIEKSGINFADFSQQLIDKFNLDRNTKGIVVVDITKLPEVSCDLQVGDVIMTIDQQNISDINEFEDIYTKISNSDKQSIVLLVKRRNTTMFIALPL